jgi:hypothetical protein
MEDYAFPSPSILANCDKRRDTLLSYEWPVFQAAKGPYHTGCKTGMAL